MRRKIKTTLLVTVLSVLFCMSASTAAYTAKMGTRGLNLFAGDVKAQTAGQAGVKDQSDQMASVSSKADYIEVEGTVIECLPYAMFRVELDDGNQVLSHISGKLRMNFIRIRVGDRVVVELNKNDLTKGRLIWKMKN